MPFDASNPTLRDSFTEARARLEPARRRPRRCAVCGGELRRDRTPAVAGFVWFRCVQCRAAVVLERAPTSRQGA